MQDGCTRFNSRAHEGRDDGFARKVRAVVVSIHAPTRGATHGTYRAYGIAAFQFTRPRGARRLTDICIYALCVSIHAPTRGATPVVSQLGGPRMFQFTRPRGARRRALCGDTRRGCFNSRAHEGRDQQSGELVLRFGVSIHAPTRGATRSGL